MIFDTPPKDFSPKIEASGCFLFHKDKFLILKRPEEKFEGGKWQLPGGKLDSGENSLQAIVREVFEETGLKLNAENFSHLKSIYVRYEEYDFLYHMYKVEVGELPKIILSEKEHSFYDWFSKEEALNLPIIKDGKEAMEIGLN